MLVGKSGPEMHRCRYTKIQDNCNLDIRKHLNKPPSSADAQNCSLATVGAWVRRLERRLRVRLAMARHLIGVGPALLQSCRLWPRRRATLGSTDVVRRRWAGQRLRNGLTVCSGHR